MKVAVLHIIITMQGNNACGDDDMLIMFRAKNFASFKNEIVLDMRAISYKDMKSHVIEEGKNKVVKTLAVFGKNASGKSNLVSALYYFESFVYNQFFDDGDRDDEIDKADRMPNLRMSTFKLSDKRDDDSEFEIIFTHNGRTFQYGFIIQNKTDSKKYAVKEEWFFIDDKKIYERNDIEISYGKKYETELSKIKNQRTDRLYIGVLDYFAEGQVKEIVDDFKFFLKRKFNVHFEVILEGSVKGFVSGVNFCKRLIDDAEYKKTIEKFLKIADVGIVGLEIKKNNEDDDSYDIKSVHEVYDESGNVVRKEEFDLDMESSGTIRYFSFIQYILNIIDDGGVFIVDEMSARLHPILTKFIVDLFQSKMNESAQLIFTTHDISLMNRKQFRRDEIAFVEKDYMGVSSVYTLADIKIRSDASFSKDYLAGKYGAIPVFDEKLYTEMAGDWICQD